MAPVKLPSNQPPDRFYKGGDQISDLRSEPRQGTYRAEDWVASTTICAGCGDSKLGLSKLPDGRYLADAVTSEPKYWLGEKHIQTHGVDTMLLLKLLDAGQRLPIHCHPHVDWAKKHLGSKHGKAEAWHILTGGEIHIGLKEDMSVDDLLAVTESQDSKSLLEKMHRVDVQPSQTVYVPPGTLHSIGQGVLVAELQEPADLSVLLEWEDFTIDGSKDGHLGLGFPVALTAVDRRARSKEEIDKLISPAGKVGSVVPGESGQYFRMDRVQVDGKTDCERGFAILVVADGEMTVATEEVKGADALKLPKGSTVVIPHQDGEFTLEGKGVAVIARPP